MPGISQRGIQIPASPIRKLTPFADSAKAKGTKVYHLNIGQPDLPTPAKALEALRRIDRTTLEYSPSNGIKSLRDKLTGYYGKFGIDVSESQIIITELPFLVNKARLLEKIAELVRDKKIDGITDLRDESDRDGMRVVVELRRDVNANIVLNQLYKHTQLQDTFGVINLALVNNEPKVMNLLEMLTHYLKHQEDVVTRRTKYDLNKAEERAHILQGLLIALDNIDEVIAIIRSSANVAEAKDKLIERFGL